MIDHQTTNPNYHFVHCMMQVEMAVVQKPNQKNLYFPHNFAIVELMNIQNWVEVDELQKIN
jgi:hypothetical protein